MQKEYFLVLDTETCNSLEEPMPYDIGYAICDRHGNIYLERSFVVAEVFCDMQDAMLSAYYAEKIPQYCHDIDNGLRVLDTLWNIRRTMIEDMKAYNVTKIGAYNMGFDKKAMNNLIRYISKSFKRYFFPYGTEYFCIWNMACNTILNRPSYIKYAEKNNLISEKNNIFTSAECAYRYIINDIDFIESHTGLEDVRIEVAIMKKCYDQHKKMNKNINSSCWQNVQKKRKEMARG